MSGLVGYGSSDEDDTGNDQALNVPKTGKGNETTADVPPKNQSTAGLPLSGDHDLSVRAPLIGPSSYPSLSLDDGATIEPIAGPAMEDLETKTSSAPQSPYSSYRALIHDLTLPPVPNFDIPDSPPGSPPPGIDKKFSDFIGLKKQGIHFNEKLARSSALKNPSLLGKLMHFAGVEEDDQYATTLPKEFWDPKGFPPWSYKEELAKSQQELTVKLQEERSKVPRTNVDFVPASGSAPSSGPSSRVATPGGTKNLKGSAAERVMAGLDRERTSSLQTTNLPSRGSSYGKNSRFDDKGRRRSRSPGKRKRSRS